MKRKRLLRLRIPEYKFPRLNWRKAIHREALATGIRYLPTDRLEIHLKLYLRGRALFVHDLDNRLKDVMDSLQGRIGGSKRLRKYAAIIPNDNQVIKVTVEKMAPPGQSHGLGHLTVRGKL